MKKRNLCTKINKSLEGLISAEMLRSSLLMFVAKKHKIIEKWHIMQNKKEVSTMVISEDEQFYNAQKRNIIWYDCS